jgi:hypothetical protein
MTYEDIFDLMTFFKKKYRRTSRKRIVLVIKEKNEDEL